MECKLFRALIALSLTFDAFCSIYEYNGLKLEYDQLLFRENGMYSPSDSPVNKGLGSFIKITGLSFTRLYDQNCEKQDSASLYADCSQKNGIIDIAILEQSYKSFLGDVVDETRYFCCTDEAFQLGACNESQKDRLIVKGGNNDNIVLRKLEIPYVHGSSIEDPDEGIIEITKTGMYQIIFANCDPVNGMIIMSGHTEWMNPYGYLPGEMYHALPYFLILSIFYLILGILWYGSSCLAFQSLQAIHIWTSFVLLLGMVETASKYYDYNSWNNNGFRSNRVLAFGLVFGVTKRALSRILVVMISMGYGVVRPTLGEDLKKLLTIGGAYWVICVLSESAQSTPPEDEDVAQKTVLISFTAMLIMLTSLLDVIFYAWTFHSLSSTINHLQAKTQFDRARPYRCFMVVLIIGLVFSTVWAVFGVLQNYNELTRKKWQLDWAVTAVWEVVYLYLLLAVCILLRPRLSGAHFFGYSAVELTDHKGRSNSKYDEDMEFGRKLSADDGDEFEMAPMNVDNEEQAYRKGRRAD